MSHQEIGDLFSTAPVERDTKLVSLRCGDVEAYPARVEEWTWEGVKGRTVIFREQDVESLSDDDLLRLVRQEMVAQGEMTIKRIYGFAFVNHSFRA